VSSFRSGDEHLQNMVDRGETILVSLKDENNRSFWTVRVGSLESKLGKVLTSAVVIALMALAITRLGSLRERPPATTHRNRILMDTVVTIRIYDGQASESAQKAVSAAFGEMERLEGLLSVWMPSSDVSRINDAAGGGLVSVNPETWQAISAAQEISRLTDGAFDISIGAVMQLWSFQTEEALMPAEAAIQRNLRLVGSHQVLLDSANIKVGLRERGAAIDLGGAAKGFAVDRVKEVLKEHGVETALVDAGGDIALLGRKPHGETWKIGIRHPRSPGETIEVLEVDSGAVATSGDYERCFFQDGVRYHHILDPKTGLPARGAISVTILANTALEADILSTAVFVLGPERGMTLIEQLGEVEGIIYIEGPGGLNRLASSGCPPSSKKTPLSSSHFPVRRSS
jgi:thiamine biosynthesis lipoprotein